MIFFITLYAFVEYLFILSIYLFHLFKIYQCRKCSKVILRKDCPRGQHRCGTSKCGSCNKYVEDDHLCCLRKIDAKASSDKIIYFDFETDQSSGEHVVNYAIAQDFNGNETVFKGYSALQDFCSWLFSPSHKGYTAIAHNMKG